MTKKTKISHQVIETVSFKLAHGVSAETFIGTTDAVGNYLKTCEGFMRRCLSKSSDGIWLEHILWQSLAAAKAASDAFMKQESILPYLQAIDPDSVTMQHQQLIACSE